MKYIKEETRFSGKYSKSVFHTIHMAILPYKSKFIFCFFLGFVGRALLLGNTNIIGKWADSLCTNAEFCGQKSTLFAHFDNTDFFILLLSISFIGFAFYTVFRISVARLGTFSASTLYDETTLRVSRFPISFFDTTPVGRIITRFSSDYNAIFRMAGGPLGEFLSIVFDLILFFGLIILASPFYIPIVLLSVFTNFMIYRLNKNKIRHERREHSISRSPVISHFAETVQGSKIIRVYGKGKSFTDHFLKKFDEYILQKNKANMTSNLFSLQMAFINVLLLLITALFGLFLAQKGFVSIGSIGVAFTFISMTQATVQIFFEWISAVEDAATGTERMSEYLNREIEEGSLLPSHTQFETPHPRLSIEDEKDIEHSDVFKCENAKIKVEHLSLRYHEDLPRALDNISFTVHAGEKVGIIGKTGSGKTTLIQALFHLYPFEKGNVALNGYQAWINTAEKRQQNQVPLDLFRSAISLISQDPILFTGTLRENLLPGKEISDEQIFSIVHKLGFQSSFLVQSNFLNMNILEKGANLSAGERQVICMIRCLLQNSPVVLMDEATSSIDPYSEEILVKATNEILKNKTQLIIAHRLSTIEDCDRVMWMSFGKIVAFDTPKIILPEFRSTNRKKR